MNNLLKLIAPNTLGGSGGKGGQNVEQNAPPPNTQASPMQGGTMMPIANPQAWTQSAAGNFMPSGGGGKGGNAQGGAGIGLIKGIFGGG